MRVLAVQLDITWEDKAANHAKVEALLAASRPVPGSLVVLPEMFATGFSMDVGRIAEERGGPTRRFLATTAQRLGVWLLGGVVTRSADGRGRNEAVLFSPEGVERGRYAKLHPFTFAGEAQHYGPGSEVVVIQCGDASLAPFVCYDLRFPEAFRIATRRGAELLAVIANWPTARVDHWLALLVARAIENQAFVVGVNRCGRDPHHPYPGRSAIVGPLGDVLAAAGGGEMIVVADLDLTGLHRYRAEFPALADIKPELVPS